ncbi:MAG: DUF934 domain-containing protein [Azonexus sp.]|jgi:uncharacterized protein (DUF934 family)|uniref:DUF934 domain-containing protein n=1 Tax=Azonexus sp. TaxID=1872668 RepID=UPI002818FF26|nr:DUF934 domain-containing protein [Azonexus sp.]MDR0776446.1 DUF934 domain-containing protein [Azonexus sp.]
MVQLIKDHAIQTDTWRTFALAKDQHAETVPLPTGDTIFPLAVWQARQVEISERGGRIGLLLQPGERVEDIADDLAHFSLIAINFPKFVDGRGYSTASLLRQRYGYRGELRAVGEVLHDQLFFMRHVGFDSYELKDGKDATQALAAGFSTFSDSYQASTSQPQPHFRRRA